MTLAAGIRLGPYEILSPIGAGGMGEVYAARDTRLDRRVAIKVLAAERASDRAYLARFTREARAASTLNHPNIVSVFDVGLSDSLAYVAMELVEGRTLLDTLGDVHLPLRKLLDLAEQIAEGLAAAHEAGIVHRDLKPANIMVTREGFVKILDFGLARQAAIEGAAESDLPTETPPPTLTGEIVGTAGYMSPEQARGGPVACQSDQFSFGSVLYEMTTGRRAFRGNTRIDTLAAVLNEEPEPISRLRPGAPPPLRWVVERCLAKSPADRYQSTRDLAREIRGIRDHLSEVSEGAMAKELPSRRHWFRLLAAAGVAAVVGAALWAAFGGSRARPAGPEFRRLTFRSGVVTRSLFMQRSNSILYTASWDGQVPRTYLTLPESKGADRSLESETQLPMAFSDDGSEVLVLLGRSRPAINSFGPLAWWPALGGKARPFLENGGWADWAKKGRFAAVVQDEGASRVLQVRDSSGKLQRAVFRTTGAISYVSLSPDEKEIAFVHHPSRTDDAGEVRIAAVDGTPGRALTPILERCVGLRWNPRTAEIWYTASRSDIYSSSLWSVGRMGGIRLVHAFPDFFVLQDIGEAGALFVASSEDTTLLLRRGEGAPSDFSWLGSTVVTDISPDGRSILFIDGSPGAGTLGTWVRPLDGGEATRIADADPGKFSPDGRWVVGTTRLPTGPPQLILVPSAGGKTRILTSSAAVAHSDPSFAGGDTILFNRSNGQRREVWRMRIDGTRAESLGVTGCGGPVADPTATRFLCIEEPDHSALVLHPLVPGAAGRTLYTLQAGETFLYARWNTRGDRIAAVTAGRRILDLDSSTGAVLLEQRVPLREGVVGESLLAAAFSPDTATQAYSISYTSSRLYMGRGLR
jgi:eukaryotic-like serine/threonine-protein kinase